jgi:hypothetical protein
LLKALDMKLASMHFFPDLMEKESIHQKPAFLEQAYNIGKSTLSVFMKQ